jgi:O-antigen ligase
LAVGGAHLRARIAMVVVLVAVGAGLISVAGGEADDRLIDPVVDRASTILSPGEVARENSYDDRKRETEIAWNTARSNPLLGVGVGAPFGVYFYEQAAAGTYVLTEQRFLHNQYLYLLLIGGVFGAAAFLAFLITPLSMALRRSPREPLVTAAGIGIVVIMMSAVVAIYFAAANMTPVLALLAGYIVADHDSGPEVVKP